MPQLLHRQMPPTPPDIAIARDSGQRLSRYARSNRPLTLRVENESRQPEQPPIQLPAGAVTLLLNILEAMAAGRGVTIIPENAELTTVQAAEVLNVSRPFLIKLLEEGAIPHRKVGKHRRVRMEDVMAYKERVDRDREGILDQLVAQAQELDMGYGR
jgi:excisionase family DNA binding protein